MKDIFQAERFPDLISGLAESDDAAVYRISDESAWIFTTDFFTPVVDDPYQFGAIAAANAMSDVYAMGGEVVLALNIACFPKDLDEDVIREILRGGAEKVLEGGGVIAGGHTVDDEEPKYGLAVLGQVHPGEIFEKSGAGPGDVLVLTKSLGSGLIATAAKGGVAEQSHIQAAAESMAQLNRTAALCARQANIRTCTDVTGFGLVGHGLEICRQSHVGMEIYTRKLPLLPGTMQYARDWLFPAGAHNNREAFESEIGFDSGIDEETAMLMFNPETSGGLLVVVPGEKFSRFAEVYRRNRQFMQEIGRVVPGTGIEFKSYPPES